MQRSTSYRPPLPRRPHAANASDTPDRCPFLGTAADPDTSLSFPSDANYCYSTRLQVPISTIHQENFCLSSNFENCPVFRQHMATQQEAALLSPAAVTAVAAGADEDEDPWASPNSPAPVALAALGASGAASAPARPPASPLGFPWDEPAHPDFQADLAASSARRSPGRVNARPVIIGLLFLALIPLVWWLWTTVRPGARGTSTATDGAIVTLPTLMATTGADATASGGASEAQTDPEADPQTDARSTPLPGTGSKGAPATTVDPTATLTDLEAVAATATALFVAATPVTECVAPSWWVPYSIEAGDTIDALAVSRGIRPEELIVANCLAGPELEPGLVLRLPPVGVIIAQLEQPTATATATPRAPGLPTRIPFPFPTPTFPVVIVIPTTFATVAPTNEPVDEPPTRPPTQPTTQPPTQPTATPPSPSGTATIPGIFPTSTPPALGTIGATQTPPGIGVTATPTPTRAATQTPPAP